MRQPNALPALALAQTATRRSSISAEANQQARIQQGVGSGSLTA